MGKLLDFLAIIGILRWGEPDRNNVQMFLSGVFFMQEVKKETLKKLEELLKVIIPQFQYLIPKNNYLTNDLQVITILIQGSQIVNVNVEGDSPEQIVKDVMKTIWSMR